MGAVAPKEKKKQKLLLVVLSLFLCSRTLSLNTKSFAADVLEI